jgi:hypothetical protein
VTLAEELADPIVRHPAEGHLAADPKGHVEPPLADAGSRQAQLHAGSRWAPAALQSPLLPLQG